MKKPRYKRDIFAIIFLFIGLGFIVFGLLSFANIIKPSAHSQVQDHSLMGLIFCIIGITFWITQGVLRHLSFRQSSLHRELVLKGTKVEGIIERITLQKSIKYGGNSPFVVHYSYIYKDKEFQSKSNLLWKKPTLIDGNQVIVYVDESGNSTIEM